MSISRHDKRAHGFSCVALDRLYYCYSGSKSCCRAMEAAVDHIPGMPIISGHLEWRYGGNFWPGQVISDMLHCHLERQRDGVDPVRGWDRRRCKCRLGSMQEASTSCWWYTGRAFLGSQGPARQQGMLLANQRWKPAWTTVLIRLCHCKGMITQPKSLREPMPEPRCATT